MNIPAKASYTREDYEQLPEGAPYQLIAGQLIMSPGPSTSHQRISVTLSRVISAFVVELGLGTVFHAPSDVRYPKQTSFNRICISSKLNASILLALSTSKAPPIF